MSEITAKDIQKVMKMLKKNKACPTKILINTTMKDEVIKMLNEQGIEMKVITDDMCDKNTAYID